MQPIEQDLRQFVIETFLFGNDNGQLSVEDSFLEKGLVDSMGILTLVSYVEDKYRIQVADAELIPDHWDSVGRIAKFIASKAATEVPQSDTAYAL